MNSISPAQVYDLCELAYKAKNKNERALAQEISRDFKTLLNNECITSLRALSGTLLPIESGFGFIARGVGARQNEIFLATRGTASISDGSTDANFVPAISAFGGFVHSGFKHTFDSYGHQLNQLIKKVIPKGRPSRVHCMGHSLGGALANLNAAALADQGHNVNLYTLAAPRVGMIGFAEHLSKKINHQNIYRVAHLADPVTMVPCFPYLHGPMAAGFINLERGHLAINPKVHGMTVGYKSIQTQSWSQLKTANQAIEHRLQTQVDQRHTAVADFQFNIAPPQAAMHSAKLLKYVGFMINDLLDSAGRRGMLTSQYWHTGAFTTLDQLAEIIYLCALQSQAAAEKARQVVATIQRFLGYPRDAVIRVTRAMLVQTFKILKATLAGMVRLAIGGK